MLQLVIVEAHSGTRAKVLLIRKKPIQNPKSFPRFSKSENYNATHFHFYVRPRDTVMTFYYYLLSYWELLYFGITARYWAYVDSVFSTLNIAAIHHHTAILPLSMCQQSEFLQFYRAAIFNWCAAKKILTHNTGFLKTVECLLVLEREGGREGEEHWHKRETLTGCLP